MEEFGALSARLDRIEAIGDWDQSSSQVLDELLLLALEAERWLQCERVPAAEREEIERLLLTLADRARAGTRPAPGPAEEIVAAAIG